MIEVCNLTKAYNNTPAVDNVSFKVEEGQTLVLLGTSGSGKTTTLRVINRLVEPTSGTVSINGRNILHQKAEELRRGIGYVLQGYGLFPHYTVAENIAVVPKLLGWKKEAIDKRVEELLNKLDVPYSQYKDLYSSNLSGGQMQRVGLARALAADPPILLMDEPFGALDPITRAGIRKEFKELDELKRKTIILVTHDVQEAFELGDRIALMDKGKLIQIGSPIELLLKPVNSFVADFFRNQRLLLEWQSISLADIWDELPTGATSSTATVSSNSTLWQALELLTSGSSSLTAYDSATATTKEITFTYLQTAIQQLKQLA